MSKELKKNLDVLGLELLKRAAMTDPTVIPLSEDAVDIFKAVSAYYLGTARVTKGQPDPEGVKTTFGAIAARVNGRGVTQ